MYPPPPSSSKSTARDGGEDENNQFDHHIPRPPRQQQDPNLVGHYFSGDPSSIGFDSNASSSSSSPLFRHRSSPAGFYNQFLPIDPNEGTAFSLGRSNGGGGERRPSRLKSELRFSGGNSSSSSSRHQERPNSEVDAAAIKGVASTSMSFGNERNNNNWDNSSSHISFTIDEPGKRSKTTDFFTLETQFSMPQTSLEMERMESLMNIPEGSVPCKARAKRGCATHPRSIAERERRTRISGKLKKLQELVPNMDSQTSYADMLDLAVEHIKGLQNQVESLEKGIEKCTCGACKKR